MINYFSNYLNFIDHQSIKHELISLFAANLIICSVPASVFSMHYTCNSAVFQISKHFFTE